MFLWPSQKVRSSLSLVLAGLSRLQGEFVLCSDRFAGVLTLRVQPLRMRRRVSPSESVLGGKVRGARLGSPVPGQSA